MDILRTGHWAPIVWCLVFSSAKFEQEKSLIQSRDQLQHTSVRRCDRFLLRICNYMNVLHKLWRKGSRKVGKSMHRCWKKGSHRWCIWRMGEGCGILEKNQLHWGCYSSRMDWGIDLRVPWDTVRIQGFLPYPKEYRSREVSGDVKLTGAADEGKCEEWKEKDENDESNDQLRGKEWNCCRGKTSITPLFKYDSI